LKKLDKAATEIQKHLRGSYIRRRYGAVLEKVKEKSRLLDKVEKIKKKIAKTKKQKEKELEKAKKGIDTEHEREIWEAGILDGERMKLSEKAKLVEYLQSEHRELQIKIKTQEGMLKPLKKNFDTLMEENKGLREEFQKVHKKNESIKKTNKDLIDRREAAEKKTKELKAELTELNTKFAPAASGRIDFQNGLNDIMQLMQDRCEDDKLLDEIMGLGQEVFSDAQGLQEEAKAKYEQSLFNSPERVKRRLGVRTPQGNKGRRGLFNRNTSLGNLGASLGDLQASLGDLGDLEDLNSPGPLKQSKTDKMHASLGDLGAPMLGEPSKPKRRGKRKT